MIVDLHWRYSTKLFEPYRMINDRDLQELKNSLMLAPSSLGIQPWKFLIITDKELRERIRAVSWSQPQVTDASHLIVLCAIKRLDEKHIKKYINQIAEVREISPESLEQFEDLIRVHISKMTKEELLTWCKKQVYTALGFLLYECAERKIDSCPIEGFNVKKVDEILDLDKQNLTAVVMCPVGYRAHDDKYAQFKKVRFYEGDLFLTYPSA